MALAASRACQLPSLYKDAGSQARSWVWPRVFGGVVRERGTASKYPHHLPGFITAPGDTDTLMVVVGIFLIGAVLMVGIFYLHLHTMPERMAHKSQKLQFEIVAVLGLLALFTHIHIFWIAGLLLAMIDLPDFSTPLRRIARSVEKMAGVPPEPDPTEPSGGGAAGHPAAPDDAKAGEAKTKVHSHA